MINSELVRLLIKQYETQIQRGWHKGICSTVYDLLFDQLITIEEKNTLITLINNKGIKESVKKKLFWWPLSDIKSRLQFLNELLNEALENENKKKESKIQDN